MNPEILDAAKTICADRFTGNLTHDDELLEVCAAGILYGCDNPPKAKKILDAVKLISAVARLANLSYLDIAIGLQIPKDIRKPALKTLEARAAQKAQNGKK